MPCCRTLLADLPPELRSQCECCRRIEPGRDRTGRHKVKVWTNPGITRNTHSIHVVSDSALLTASIENLPMVDNSRSSRITAASIVSCLRRLGATLRVGT